MFIDTPHPGIATHQLTKRLNKLFYRAQVCASELEAVRARMAAQSLHRFWRPQALRCAQPLWVSFSVRSPRLALEPQALK